jgi:parvulin-like peptidyl-prolyl isomerase
MGKRKQTLARPPQRMTKKERSRWQRERRIQRNLIIIFAAIGLVSILVLAYGLWAEMVGEPGQVIARVNGEDITRRDYWSARRLQLINTWYQQESQFSLSQSQGVTMTDEQVTSFQQEVRNNLLTLAQVRRESLDDTAVQQLIHDTVLTQGARDLGIQATDDEVDAWLLRGSEAGSTPFETAPISGTQPATATLATPTPVNTMTPLERKDLIDERLSSVYDALVRDMKTFAAGSLGFSRDEYIAMVRLSNRAAYLEQMVQDYLQENEVAKTEEQVQASQILFTDRQVKAKQALQALQQGTSFAQVVAKYSDDAATRNLAGDLGWLTRGEGQPSPQVEAAAFAITETNGFSPVFTDTQGVHILQLVERHDAANQVRVRDILFEVDRQAVASSLLSLLRSQPTQFAAAAKDHSEDAATAGQGGDLGWLTKGEGQPSPQVEVAAFALTQTNQLSPVVSDAAGLHILQLVEPITKTATGQEQAHVRDILIRTGTRTVMSLAQSVLNRLRAASDYDFTQAVIDYSSDARAVGQAGDLGWLTRGEGRPSPQVEAAAFAITQTNGISPIITDTHGYHILQLVEPVTRTAAGQEQVHVRGILVKYTKDLAQQVYDEINACDADTRSGCFLQAALKYSDDSQSKANGGDLGWFGRGTYPELEDVAFDPANVGQIKLFEQRSGWHILWVRAHEQDRPLDETTLKSKAQQLYNGWLQNLTDSAKIERFPPPTAVPTLPVPTSLPTLPATTAPVTGTATP